jgi:Type IV secretion system pilin
MIQKIKIALLRLSAVLVIASPLAISGGVAAQNVQNNINGNTCGGSDLNINGGSDCSNTQGAGTTLNSRIATVVNVMSAIVGIIAVIIIIVAGLRYVSSGGSEEGVKGAKNSIMYAIIGLVIVALAQIIVHFVLNKATGTTST